MNVFLPLISISSKVSKQSEMNDGHKIPINFAPSVGSRSSLLSVKGVNHPGPILD